jgi:hypothetical protein
MIDPRSQVYSKAYFLNKQIIIFIIPASNNELSSWVVIMNLDKLLFAASTSIYVIRFALNILLDIVGVTYFNW